MIFQILFMLKVFVCFHSFIRQKIISLRQKIGISHLSQNHKFKTQPRTESNSIYQSQNLLNFIEL
jgi:hypothetical protein